MLALKKQEMARLRESLHIPSDYWISSKQIDILKFLFWNKVNFHRSLFPDIWRVSFIFKFFFASDQLVETLKTSPVYDPFTKSSFFWTFLSILLSLSDYGSDIAVAVLLYGEADTDWWFALTLTLILVPLTLVNTFSIFWHHQVRLLCSFCSDSPPYCSVQD